MKVLRRSYLITPREFRITPKSAAPMRVYSQVKFTVFCQLAISRWRRSSVVSMTFSWPKARCSETSDAFRVNPCG